MYLSERSLKPHNFFGFLALVLLLSGCFAQNHKSILIQSDKQTLSILPLALQKEQISISEILNFYENLDPKQRALALEHVLNQANLSLMEEAQAAYMLGRVLQQSLNKTDIQGSNKEKCKEALALFQRAKTYLPLKTNSLWHINEVATINGDEKVVRQALSQLLEGVSDSSVVASVQYALAQSYLRANEIDKASLLFKKISVDFANTNYGLGSAYYLGTLAYAKFEQEQKSQTNQNQTDLYLNNPLLKTVLRYYRKYLEDSPSGRFALDILAKLQVLNGLSRNLLKPDDIAVMADVYFTNHKYKEALFYWQRAGADKYFFEIGDCLVKNGRVQAAVQQLLKGVDKYPEDKRYLSLANAISEKLNKKDSFKLWERLQKSKLCAQDEVVWNLATRSSPPQALGYYQQLISFYPSSSYAAEAQWRIFWQKIKQSKGKSLANIGNWCAAAAKKYSHSKLAPRFLFWAGKISEMLANKTEAESYYQEVQNLYRTDYYGQRAKFRWAEIKNGQKDNYFELKSALRNHFQLWEWPEPKSIVENLQIKDKSTIAELIYLKQYDEVLKQSSDLPLEIIVWLIGKRKQPMLAINTAAKGLLGNIQNKDFVKNLDRDLLWQYSYPLLYSKEISTYSHTAGIVDPMLVHALIREESRYETRAVSATGALGLCQLMPATAASIARCQEINMLDNSQLYDPELNIKLGTVYLSSLLKAFDGNGLYAIASYNAGAGVIKNQLKNKQSALISDADYFVEDFPYRETRDYIRKVFSSYYQYREIYH